MNSTAPINLSGNSSTTVSIVHNYTSPGDIFLNCSVVSSDGNDSEATEFTIPGLVIESYHLFSNAINAKIATFHIFNYFTPQTNALWNISTGEQVLTGIPTPNAQYMRNL